MVVIIALVATEAEDYIPMDVTDMFPSKYLRGLDLKGPITVTLASVQPEKVYKPGVGETGVYVLY